MWELLTKVKYADGSKRELPTIKITVAGGKLLAVLQDHASRSQLHAHADTWEEVLDALEAASGREESWREYDSPILTERAFHARYEKQA